MTCLNKENMNYGRSIQTLRKRRGLTQRELAARAGVDQSYVSLLERGERIPNMDVLETLARELGTPLALLVLLASDTEDLRNVSPDDAQELGAEILKLVDGIATARAST